MQPLITNTGFILYLLPYRMAEDARGILGGRFISLCFRSYAIQSIFICNHKISAVLVTRCILMQTGNKTVGSSCMSIAIFEHYSLFRNFLGSLLYSLIPEIMELNRRAIVHIKLRTSKQTKMALFFSNK